MFAAWAAVGLAAAADVVVLDRARFVPGAATAPLDAAAGHDVVLPHRWDVSEGDLAGDAWYILRWRTFEGGTPLALYLTAITFPAEVWLNGRPVWGLGTLDRPPPRSFEQSRLIALSPDDTRPGDNALVLRVRVRPGHFAGLAPVLAGDAAELAHRARVDLVEYTLAPAAIAVSTLSGGLFILGLWARRRDASYALFGFAAVLWSMHTLVTLLPDAPLPQPHYGILWNGVYLLFVALLCLFMVRFAEVRWRAYRRLVVAYAAAVVPVLYLATWAGVGDTVATIVRLGGILVVLAALFAVARYALRRFDAENALLLGTGTLSAAFAVRDWLVANDATTVRPVWLVPYAGLGFLLLVGWILIDRFVRARNEAERLNVDLEARVADKSAALERQLVATRQARDAAIAADAAKSRFLAAASHDLRQPLHALGLFASALADEVTTPAQTALAQRIARSVDALEALFSSLLDISRLDAGVVHAHPVPIRADDLLDRIAHDFAPEALERSLRFAVVPSRAIVRSDPVLLERILRNLVSNAMRYTRTGGVVVGCRPRGTDVAFEVWDTGPGIAPGDRERIFEEFWQAGSRELDRAGGLGLGLAIVRRLAGLLGHRVVVDSRPGRGSIFRVIVPRVTELPAAEAEDVAPARSGLAGKRVLVIEDESPVREGMERLLHAWECEAWLAADADEALRMVRANGPPDGLVVDYLLRAGQDGLTVIAAVREACGRAVPALIVSGESHREELARIKASGFVLLHKPVPPAKLRSALAWLVADPPAARSA
jgi:signal transduction histidine kinase